MILATSATLPSRRKLLQPTCSTAKVGGEEVERGLLDHPQRRIAGGRERAVAVGSQQRDQELRRVRECIDLSGTLDGIRGVGVAVDHQQRCVDVGEIAAGVAGHRAPDRDRGTNARIGAPGAEGKNVGGRGTELVPRRRDAVPVDDRSEATLHSVEHAVDHEARVGHAFGEIDDDLSILVGIGIRGRFVRGNRHDVAGLGPRVEQRRVRRRVCTEPVAEQDQRVWTPFRRARRVLDRERGRPPRGRVIDGRREGAALVVEAQRRDADREVGWPRCCSACHCGARAEREHGDQQTTEHGGALPHAGHVTAVDGSSFSHPYRGGARERPRARRATTRGTRRSTRSRR